MGCELSKEEPELAPKEPALQVASGGTSFPLEFNLKIGIPRDEEQNQNTIFRARGIEMCAACRGQTQSISGLGPGISQFPCPRGSAVVQWTSGVWLLHTCSHLFAPPPPTHIQTETVGVRLKSLLLLEYSANSVVSMLLWGSIDSAGLSEQRQTPFSVHPSSFSEQSLQNAIYRLILFKSTFSKKKKTKQNSTFPLIPRYQAFYYFDKFFRLEWDL